MDKLFAYPPFYIIDDETSPNSNFKIVDGRREHRAMSSVQHMHEIKLRMLARFYIEVCQRLEDILIIFLPNQQILTVIISYISAVDMNMH